MSFDAGTITSRLLLSTEQFDSKLKQSDSKAKSFGQSFASMASKIGGGLAFGSMAKGILTAGANLEKTRIALQTFTGSVDAGNKALKDLQEFANVTPFNTDEVVESGKMMIAFGVKPGKELRDVMTQIGDAASGVGKPLREVGLVYGQVMAKGRLQGEEMLQLQEKGIPIAEALTKVTGKTGVALQKMISNGQVSSEVFKEAFATMNAEGGKFQGLMEKQSKTMGGLASTIQGKFTNAMAEFGEKISSFVNPVLAKTIEIWDMLGSKGESLAVIGAVVAAAFIAIGGPISLLIGGVLVLINYWDEIMDLMGGSGKVMQDLKVQLALLWGAFQNAFNQILGLAKTVFGWFSDEGVGSFDGISIAVKGMAIAFSVVLGVVKILINSIRTFVNVISNVWQFLKDIASGDILQAFSNFAENTKNTMVSAFGNTKDIITGTAKEIGNILTNELPKAGAEAGSETGKEIDKNIKEETKGTGKSAGEDIGKTMGQQISDVLMGSGSLFDKIGGVIGKAIGGEAGAAIGSMISQTMSQVFDSLQKIASNKLQALTNMIGLIGDVLSGNLKAQLDAEIKNITAIEDAKIKALKDSLAEQNSLIKAQLNANLDVINKQLQTNLDAIDQEMNAKIEAEKASNEAKREELMNTGMTESAIRANDAALQNDLADVLAQLEEERRLKKEEEERIAAEKRLAEQLAAEERMRIANEKLQKAIIKAEEDKEKRIEALRVARELKEKNFAKAKAAIDYGLALAAHRVNQQKERAAVIMQTGSGLISAISAGMTFGPAAIAMVPILSGMVLAGASVAMAAVNSAPPPLPSATLFLKDGGVVSMNAPGTTTSDSIDAKISAGESVLSAKNTKIMLDGFKNGGMGGVTINIEQGAFVNQPINENELIEVLNDKLPKMFERKI